MVSLSRCAAHAFSAIAPAHHRAYTNSVILPPHSHHPIHRESKIMAFSKKDKSELTPPSIRYGAHQEALAHLRQHGAPTNLTGSDVIRGTLSEGVYSELIRVWRRLGLVNNDSEPEEYLHRLINADGKHSQQVLREILASSYPFILAPGSESLNLEKVTAEELSERFIQAGTSKAAVRGCVSFFTKMAHDAGIPLSKELIGQQQDINKVAASTIKTIKSDAKQSRHHNPVTDVLLSKLPDLPDFDNGWPADHRGSWLDSYNQALQIVRIEKEKDR
jgi:hypothetical protein